MLTGNIFNRNHLPTLLRQLSFVCISLFALSSSSIGQQMIQSPGDAKILKKMRVILLAKHLMTYLKKLNHK